MILYNDDCIDRMKQMIEDGVQVDSIVTDPPYELGFLGKSWDSTGIAFSKETWELALKLLKPGGHLLAFSGSRTYHRMAVAIEDAGFEIRDQIMWLYGSGFPKSHNVSKGIDKLMGVERKLTGRVKPGHEEFTGRKTKGHIKHAYATEGSDSPWMHNDESRERYHMETEAGSNEAKEWEGWGTALKPAHEPVVMARKPLSEKTIVENVLKHGTGGINIDDCRIELNGDYKSKANARPSLTGLPDNYDPAKANMPDTIGRYPANVMQDGSDVVKDGFPTTSKHGDEVSTSRYFYSPKVSKKERNQGVGVKNIHPTVKPVELMKYLCRLVTPKGGTVLDPFMGSGSTGMAAKYEKFDFIGIEREVEYFEIATSRIDSVEIPSTLESFLN